MGVYLTTFGVPGFVSAGSCGTAGSCCSAGSFGSTGRCLLRGLHFRVGNVLVNFKCPQICFCGDLWHRGELLLRRELSLQGVVRSCGFAGSCVPRGQPRVCWWTACDEQLVGPVMGCAQLAGEDEQSPLVLTASPSEVTLGAQAESPLKVILGAAGLRLVLLQGVWSQLMMGEH